MGTTFSSIQVNNNQGVSPEQLAEKFSRYIKKKKLIPATEEDANYSYRIAFSQGTDWVSISSEEFGEDADSFISEVKDLSKSLETSCVGISIFDSDALVLYLFDATNKRKDIVAVGQPEIVEEITGKKHSTTGGTQGCWNKLLKAGNTWEQLTKVWGNEYVMAEDALTEMAPLLGMDQKLVMANYEYWDDEAAENPLVITLHFKDNVPVFFQKEPTKIVIESYPWILSGREDGMTFYNAGGVSKGMTITIYGDCIENEEVEVKEISVEWVKDPHIQGNDWYNAREVFVVHPIMTELSNGKPGLLYRCDDFVFPVGVNKYHPSMRGAKGSDIIHRHSVRLRFTATIKSGSKHEFIVCVIPQCNFEGGASVRIPIADSTEFSKLEFPK